MSDGGDGGDGDGVRKDSHRGSQVSEGGTPRSTAGGSSGSDSPSNLGRSTKVPSSVASATNLAIAIGSTTGAADLSGILLACREATHQLDLGVREAVSHREKCAVVLGAAVAVNIALAEAEAMHHALDSQVQTQLKRLGVGVLSVLGLAVARVQVYGKYTSAQKATRIFRYAATASKFDELRLDLEALEGQLWNLTGAVGGLGAGGTIAGGGKDHKQLGSNGKSFSGRRKKTNRTGGKNGTTSMRKLSAGPDKSRRLLRGGASHWVMGGNVRVMCAAGVDGAELWWSSNRTNRLSAFDLFLQSRRAVDAPTKGDNGNGPGSVLCMGGCFGEVTAIAAEEASALLWTGTATGEVAAWDTDVACQWGGVARVCGKNKTVAVTAIAPVASGVAWCAFLDGRLVEVSRPNRLEDDTTVRRVVCDSSQRPTGTPNDADRGGFTDLTLTVAKVSTGAVGWNGAPGSRKKDACATELIRLGPLVWASMDDMVLEAWDVDSGTCVAIAPHRDLGVCVGIAAHAAAGQVVTTHASGAVQLWCATCANGGGSAVGNRAEMVAGPNSSEGRAIGSASVDRLLVVGYRNGSMKVYGKYFSFTTVRLPDCPYTTDTFCFTISASRSRRKRRRFGFGKRPNRAESYPPWKRAIRYVFGSVRAHVPPGASTAPGSWKNKSAQVGDDAFTSGGRNGAHRRGDDWFLRKHDFLAARGAGSRGHRVSSSRPAGPWCEVRHVGWRYRCRAARQTGAPFHGRAG